MDENRKKEFVKELKALLNKYDVSIGFVCDACSDMHGLYDERIEVQENKTDKVVCSAYSYWMDANNIEIKN